MFYSLLSFKSRRAYLNFTQLYILQNFHHFTWIEDGSSRIYQLFSINETLLKALTFIYRLFSFARGIKKSQAQDPSQIWPKNPKNAKVNPNCETNLLATEDQDSVLLKPWNAVFYIPDTNTTVIVRWFFFFLQPHHTSFFYFPMYLMHNCRD